MALSHALRLKILAAVLFSSCGGGTAVGVLLPWYSQPSPARYGGTRDWGTRGEPTSESTSKVSWNGTSAAFHGRLVLGLGLLGGAAGAASCLFRRRGETGDAARRILARISLVAFLAAVAVTSADLLAYRGQLRIGVRVAFGASLLGAVLAFFLNGGMHALAVLLDPGGQPPRKKPVSSWLTDVFE